MENGVPQKNRRLLVHASRRMLERFKIYFTEEEQHKIRNLILENKSRYFVCQSKNPRSEIHRIPYKGRFIYVVFHKHLKVVITVLPPGNKYQRQYKEIMVSKEKNYLRQKNKKKDRKKSQNKQQVQPKKPLIFRSIYYEDFLRRKKT